MFKFEKLAKSKTLCEEYRLKTNKLSASKNIQPSLKHSHIAYNCNICCRSKANFDVNFFRIKVKLMSVSTTV